MDNMDNNNIHNTDNMNNNNVDEKNSWGSGVKFVEEKKPKRLMKILSLILVIIFSASIGGITGGYYVLKNMGTSLGTKEQVINNLSSTSSTALPATSISKVADAVGPAVVGVENNVQSWTGTKTTQGTGSGIIFDKSGYIVTNEHVIDGANSVTVTLPGGKQLNATIVGSDTRTDIAVLKVNSLNLPVAKFGDSSKVRVGDTAIAIGNPLGEEFAGSVTAGVISALNRTLQVDGKTYKVIQTDASINEGNSGGALCNAAGEVIGINSIKASNAEGMGFAIPTNVVLPIIKELMKNGYISRPYLGISYSFIDSDTASAHGVPEGAYIATVENGSAAESAGITAGDIITEFDGIKITSESSLSDAILKHKVGDTVQLKLYRDGKTGTVKVKLKDSNGK